MPLSDIPQRQPDYRLEQFEDELILFHPNQAKILYCNPTASLIWRLCDGRRTTAVIISLLRAAFPEAASTLTQEVETTLGQFQQHGAMIMSCPTHRPAGVPLIDSKFCGGVSA